MTVPETPEELENLQRLFELALEQRPEQHSIFLSQACGGDAQLKAQVQALLICDQEENGLLDRPLVRRPQEQPQNIVGKHIGAYRIKALLGEGGMGEVYLAERDDGEFFKQVAIKLLRVGPGYKLLAGRFESERQILAQLEHPNIVRLLDGGRTEEGHLYLVMEYVDGLPIDQHCKQQVLNLPGRLQLFLRVCEAVEHAHRNLVVHRDLKPANILVTDAGQPKLLDFGIARLLAPDIFHRPFDPTITLLRAATPRYASPEQISGGVITTASDVYSLGVLLYELLSGRSPYREPEDLIHEVARAVLEEEPEKPSRAVARTEDPDTRHGFISKSFRLRLEGDLDNIVLKALSKDPARRYLSVEAFAQDICHFLEGRPVSAHPPTWDYVIGKFVQRHGTIAASIAIAVISLVGGSAFALWQARQATISEIGALDISAEALLASHQQIEAQLTAIQAASQLNTLWWPPLALAKQTRETVQKVGYLSREVNRVHVDKEWLMGLTSVPNSNVLVTSGRQVQFWRPDGSLLLTLHSAGKWVYSVAYNSTGTMFVTSGGHGAIKLFRSQDYSLTAEFKGHTDGVPRAIFSPDGQTLASVSWDGTLRLWDIRTGKLLRTILAHKEGALSVAYSPSGQFLATGGTDGTVKIWNPQNGQLLRALRSHTDAVYSLEFSPNGQYLVTASWDKTVRLWTQEGKLLNTLRGHSDKVWAAHFDQTSTLLATASDDRTIKVWNVADGSLRETLEGHKKGVNNVAFLDHPGKLVSVGEDGTLRFWDLLDSPAQMLGEYPPGLASISYSPTRQLIALASRDNTIRVLRLDGTPVKTLIGHTDNVYEVAFSPDGEHIASASGDSTVRVWRLSSNLPPQIMRSTTGSVFALAYSPDGRGVAAAGSDRIIRIWSATGGYPIKDFAAQLAFTPEINADKILKLPDGRMSAKERIIIRSARGNPSKILTAHTDAITSLNFSPDGKMLVSASDDNTLRLWGSNHGVRVLAGHTDPVKSVVFSPNGNMIASTGDDGTIRLWNVASGKPIMVWQTDSQSIVVIRFSLDGRFIIAGNDNGTISVWRLDGSLVQVLHGHRDQVRGLSFTSDGKSLISVGLDGRAILWKWTAIEQDYSQRICRSLQDYLTKADVSPNTRSICEEELMKRS